MLVAVNSLRDWGGAGWMGLYVVAGELKRGRDETVEAGDCDLSCHGGGKYFQGGRDEHQEKDAELSSG